MHKKGNEADQYFNSQPHEEADPVSLVHRPLSSYFNSQPHEEADGDYHRIQEILEAFQLTASRRG